MDHPMPFEIILKLLIFSPIRIFDCLWNVPTFAINDVDVLRDQSKETKFWFYEVYENPEAVDFHKTQAHYQSWADFKESGGTVSSVSHKADGEFIGGKA
jgi:hypothetical protein